MTSGDAAQSKQLARRIKDARGRLVLQLDPVLMALLRRGGGIPLDVVRAMAEQIGFGLTRAVRWLFWLSMFCLSFFFIATTIDIVHSIVTLGSARLSEFFGRVAPFAATWAGPLLLWAVGRSARATRITDVMLDHRRCPHCGYDIRDLPVDPADGATVCPECGCAWRLDAGAPGPSGAG